MIKTNDLTKIFRTEDVETTALNKVTLDVKEGEYVAVMGPSGCGKSTLLNILGLLDNPTSGSYIFNGTEVANLKERDRTIFRKGNIGFVFQSEDHERSETITHFASGRSGSCPCRHEGADPDFRTTRHH